jgi:hypothetical protein
MGHETSERMSWLVAAAEAIEATEGYGYTGLTITTEMRGPSFNPFRIVLTSLRYERRKPVDPLHAERSPIAKTMTESVALPPTQSVPAAMRAGYVFGALSRMHAQLREAMPDGITSSPEAHERRLASEVPK